MTRTAFAASAFVASVVLAAHPVAQQTQPQTRPVFKSRADLIQVDAVVIDGRGQPIHGLTQADFVLFDRGTQQVIDAFEEVSHAPTAAPVFPATLKMDVADNATALSTRLVVIGLDDLHMQGKTQAIKDMARRVVEQIGPSASLALVTTSGEFGVEPTEDRSLLLRELDLFLDKFDPEGRRLADRRPVPTPGYLPWDSAEGLGFVPSIPADSAPFYANLGSFKTIKEVAKKIGTDDSRRKAMVWITGGIPGPRAARCGVDMKPRPGETPDPLPPGRGREAVDPHGCMALAGVMNMLRRSNVVTYAVETGDFPSPVFDDITWGSGGFTIDMEHFDYDLDRIINDLDHYYLLGFYPSNPDGGGYRALEVRVNIPGATVRARRGYEPGAAPKPPKNKDPLAKLSAEVLPKTELPLKLSAAPIPGTRGNKTDVIITLEVRSDDGPRIDPGKSVPEVLKYSVWAVDLKKKKPVSHVGREAKVTFAPAAVQDERVREVRYQVHTRLSLPPGRYQFRASASSSQLNRSGSVYFDTDVPDFKTAPLTVGGVLIGYSTGARIFNMESPLVKGLIPFEPTLDREFSVEDTLRVFTRVGGTNAASCSPSVTLGKPDGADVRSIEAPLKSGALDATVPLKDLLPGTYVVRAGCGLGTTREIGFVVK